MVYRFLLAALLFLSFPAFAQTGTITGKITDRKTGEALPFVNVFLSGATKSAQSNESGIFSLTGIKPGQYDLVVSCIGYEKQMLHVAVNEDKQNLQFSLVSKTVELAGITLKPDPDRLKNYTSFKRYFLGNSENAVQCKILNSEVISLSLNNQVLSASSSDFIVVENKFLGYTLRYLLNSFEANYQTTALYYEGQVFFEEMKGDEGQQKKWKKNRLETYYGSSMHFFRSLTGNTLKANHFELRRLIRYENKERLPDSLISAKLNLFYEENKSHAVSDSLNYWLGQSKIPKYTQALVKDTLRTATLLRKTTTPGILGLTFNNNLFVSYTGKKTFAHNPTAFPLAEVFNNPASVLTRTEPMIFFDANGILINPRSMLVEGDWKERVPELLPVDYEPEKPG